jgi:lysozyme family protein
MKNNFEQSLAYVLKSEGGFVNNIKDPGGMTNLGVTKATYEAYLGRAVTEDEMKALTPDTVAPLYKAMYWDKVRGDDLASGLDYALFDFAVNSGPRQATKFIQNIASVPADGMMGDRTVQMLANLDASDCITRLCDERLQFLKQLNTWNTFGKGWQKRVDAVQKRALDMVNAS